MMGEDAATTIVRRVRPSDAAAIAAIYAPIVERSIISFEEVAPTSAGIRERIEAVAETWPWLVAAADDEVLGYVYASEHRTRAAYRWSVDVTAYVREDARGRGIGRDLYGVLFRVLELQGFHRAFAGITLPNDASVALHRSAGFEPVGVYREVGFKLGAWRDVSWWQRSIGGAAPPSNDPLTLSQIGAQRLRQAGVLG
jgi:L-amino acid N-acyltransferase YncA